MKTFEDIMKKREELMNECRLEGVATVEHIINGGVYGMLWAVGHEDAQDFLSRMKLGSCSSELMLSAIDILV